MKACTSSILALMAASPAMANWATLGEPLSYNCADTCSSVSPEFSDDNFEKLCAKLVENGCDDKKAVKGTSGALVFSHRDVVGCETSKPATVEECSRFFKAAYIVPGVVHGIGGSRAWYVDVIDGEDVKVGTIGITGTCLPLGIDPGNPCA